MHLPTKELLGHLCVCKVWHKVGTEVAKRKILLEAENDLKNKISNFLKMVNGKFEDYFPMSPSKSIKLQSLKDHSSIQEFATAVKAYQSTLVQKVDVCFTGCIGISADATHIPSELVDDLAGKYFAHFNYQINIEKQAENPIYASWPLKIIQTFFPVELFDLAVKDEKKIIGEQNKGSFIIPYKGKMYELNLVPEKERMICTALMVERCRNALISFEIKSANGDSEFTIHSFFYENRKIKIYSRD